MNRTIYSFNGKLDKYEEALEVYALRGLLAA